MAGYNKVVLIGNITRDPEMKFLQDGRPVCNVGLAVNRVWKDKETGEKKQEVDFFDIQAWDTNAELLNERQKGDAMFFEGRLKQERWTDKNTGGNRSRVRVLVDQLQFVGGDLSTEGAQNQSQDAGGDASPEYGDDDIPF